LDAPRPVVEMTVLTYDLTLTYPLLNTIPVVKERRLDKLVAWNLCGLTELAIDF
jgi:hypothetical protein